MINQYRRYYYEVQYQIKVDAKVNDSGNYFFHSQDELKEADFITNIASYLKTTNDSVLINSYQALSHDKWQERGGVFEEHTFIRS